MRQEILVLTPQYVTHSGLVVEIMQKQRACHPLL
jgi:hypothetical protein